MDIESLRKNYQTTYYLGFWLAFNTEHCGSYTQQTVYPENLCQCISCSLKYGLDKEIESRNHVLDKKHLTNDYRKS